MGDMEHYAQRSSDEASDTGSLRASSTRPRYQNTNLTGPLYMQRAGNVVLVRRLRKKEESTWKHLARWFVENQVGLSINLLALAFLSNLCIPRARQYTTKFFHLAYYNPKTSKYASGSDDAYLITLFVVLFTGLRAAAMEYVLAPFAKLQGIRKRKDLTRFSEQAWLLIYYVIFWSVGMYIYCNSPFYLNLRELWTDWPNREIDGLMKVYMLAQWAFWLQQIIVINIEDRRKDHWQMFSHHIITTALVSSCYCYHHTRVGTFILVIMDVVDLFLPVAKCLKYCGYKTLCDIAFGLFMVVWFVARHVIYLTVCWSIYAHSPQIMPNGCFTGPSDALCHWPGVLQRNCQMGFPYPLLLLQVITIVWFTMIIGVAVRILRGQGADDSRSDDEGDDEDDEYFYEEAQPLEKEVGVESIDFHYWERRTGLKRQGGATSGVSLPGHSDRKELLGRIGCEKQVD
ncbi:Sphingosine N-acyltransferase-like protein FUM18 [Cladobotryum mycophilum]|uniref:Sphingosine N-acyltransferase-like protein FUM18 n=1 Tax=Cladobotryum mycophilum TaxID=491253 RepID=A0ABR0SGH5_9HYPO